MGSRLVVTVVLFLGAIACGEGDAGRQPAPPSAVTGRLAVWGCGDPVAGAAVTVAGAPVSTATDRDGSFRLELAPGTYTLTLGAPGALPGQRLAGVRVAAGQLADLGVISLVLEEPPSACASGAEPGLGLSGTPEDGGDEPEALAPVPGALGIARQGLGGCPVVALRTITAVNKHGAAHCTDTPGEIDLEEYVRGVVFGEVAILAWSRDAQGRLLSDDPARLAELFATFAVAARTYVVNRVEQRHGPVEAAQVTSGPSFQCYVQVPRSTSSALLLALDQAMEETAGRYLVFSGTDRLLESEYAASCVADFTRAEQPGGGKEEVADDEGLEPLRTKGGFRQHVTCGGHEGGGSCPGGSITRNRVVRGVCQTGSAERAMAGASHAEILAHYQPYAELCGERSELTLEAPVDEEAIEEVTGAFGLRFEWRDEAGGAGASYVIHLLREGGTEETVTVGPGGEPGQRTTSSGGVVAWVGVPADYEPHAAYSWWVERDGAASAHATFWTSPSRLSLVVSWDREAVPDAELDAALVVPAAAGTTGQAVVGFLSQGRTGAYPFATLTQHDGRAGWSTGAHTFDVYEALPGEYRLAVYDLRHPGGGATDLAGAGTQVRAIRRAACRAEACATVVDVAAPAGSYNLWSALRLGAELTPAADGATGVCDFRGSLETCLVP